MEATEDTPPRGRSRRTPPTVVFQPPTPVTETAPAPRPRAGGALSGPDPASRAGTAAAEAVDTGPGTRPGGAATEPDDTDPGAPPAVLPGEPAVPAPPPAAGNPMPGEVSAGSTTSGGSPVGATATGPAPVAKGTPKRARRASTGTAATEDGTAAAVEVTPAGKRTAPAAKKAALAARKAAGATRKTSGAPEFTAPAGTEPSTAGPRPDDALPVTAEESGATSRPARARRTTKAAPAARTSPAKRTAEQAAADVAPDAGPGAETAGPGAETAGPERVGGDVAQPTPAGTGERSTGPADGSAAVARTPVEGWRAVGPRLRDHPGFAPELLALAAVDALGPRARDWVEQVRRAYPQADADGVARLATRRFVRMAGTGGALAAGTGLFAPVAELTAVLWTQANLVLHLAAAYGREPAHPDRAAELLVLTSVHPDDGTARAALAAARAADEPADGPWGRVAEAAWRLATPVAAQAGGWLGLRLAARLLPGAAALAAATGGTAAAERLAARAVARYRPTRA
ncbi:hypothetical protein [Micromonospora sp. WMMA1996]|uniref:hypothetical protein n=1 Tax=Micromonospora sp. WMMA1996 TaxID=2039878 RepID=UPI0020D2772F|nr:hypothetical protein [Micromonospora sp. WMMA1996]